MAKRMAMCSASFSRVGLSDESEGACAARAESAWLTVKRAPWQRGKPRLEGLRIELLVRALAGAGDLREHLHDALQFILVQSHQSSFNRHGAGGCAGRTAAANAGGGVAPTAGLAGFDAFACGIG